MVNAKKFAGNRKLDEIIERANNQGAEVDMANFNSGGDFIYILVFSNGAPRIAYNTFDGGFMIYKEEECIAKHTSVEFDNEKWYQEILELVYEPVIN